MNAPEPLREEIERFLLAYRWMPEATFGFIYLRTLTTFDTDAPSYEEVASFLCAAWRGKRYLNRYHRDQVVAGWLRRNRDSGTAAQIRALCEGKFGPDRTPPESTLGRFLSRCGPPRTSAAHYKFRSAPRGRRTAGAAIDAAMARWIRQVAPHMTIAGLLAALAARFRGVHMPSRSVLQRHLKQKGIATTGRETRFDRNPELAGWLRSHARTFTLDQLRDAAAKRFGPGNAPSRSVIHRTLKKQSLTGHKPRPGWPADIEVWVLEQSGLLSLDSLRAACIARFGRHRTPSRSTIHRHLQAARAQDGLS